MRLTKLASYSVFFLGIITTGTDKYYIEAFILFFSKDRRNWKLYKGVMSKERKVRISL